MIKIDIYPMNNYIRKLSLLKMQLMENIGFVSGGIKNVTPREAFELIKKGAYILDVREVYMNNFKKFNVDNLLYCPETILEGKTQELPKDQILIVADATGLNSKQAVLMLNKKGFDNIYNLAGGIVEWERDGLPVTVDKKNLLGGSCMCMLKPGKK